MPGLSLRIKASQSQKIASQPQIWNLNFSQKSLRMKKKKKKRKKMKMKCVQCAWMGTRRQAKWYCCLAKLTFSIRSASPTGSSRTRFALLAGS